MSRTMIAAALRGEATLPDEAKSRAGVVQALLNAAGVRPNEVSDETLEEAYLLVDRVLFESAQARVLSA